MEHCVALVMAGGRGERMRASGCSTPKPLVPLCGIPLLERNLRMLLGMGFRDIVVAVSQAVPEVGRFVEDQGMPLALAAGAALRCASEAEPLGTIGAAAHLRGVVDSVVVVNADNLIGIDLRAMLSHHLSKNASLTIAAHIQPFRIPFGQLQICDGRVTAYIEKPEHPVTVSSGTYVLSAEAIDLLPAQRRTDVPWLVERLIASGRPVESYFHDSAWIDVNDVASVQQAEQMLMDRPAVFGPGRAVPVLKLLDKSILVTGAGGFIGSRVIPELLGRGAKVRALLGPPGSPAFAGEAAVLTAFVDITQDAAQVMDLCDGVDTVIHMAGPPSVAESFSDPVGYVNAHVLGTAVVLQALRKASVKHIVYVSSAEVYGTPLSNPVSECHPLAPRSPYGAAKTCAENLVMAFSRTFGIQSVLLRPFCVYGPGLSRQSLIGSLLQRCVSQQELMVADPQPVRDFCYVDDVARAIGDACLAFGEQPLIVNIGSGRGMSVAQVVEHVRALCAAETTMPGQAPARRPTDVLEMIADVTRARELLGWVPTTSFQQGIGQTLEWMEAACPSAC